jgi:hypothetical protein
VASRDFRLDCPSNPSFYPALNEEYATRIARDWNARNSGSGYVTRFEVNASFLSIYGVHTVGNAAHKEYRIPTERLPQFNENTVGDR